MVRGREIVLGEGREVVVRGRELVLVGRLDVVVRGVYLREIVVGLEVFAAGFDLVVLVRITVVRDVVLVEGGLLDAVVCGGGRDVLGRVVVVVLGRDELVVLFREPLLAEEPEFLDLLLVPAARPRICPRVLNMVLEVELPLSVRSLRFLALAGPVVGAGSPCRGFTPRTTPGAAGGTARIFLCPTSDPLLPALVRGSLREVVLPPSVDVMERSERRLASVRGLSPLTVRSRAPPVAASLLPPVPSRALRASASPRLLSYFLLSKSRLTITPVPLPPYQ